MASVTTVRVTNDEFWKQMMNFVKKNEKICLTNEKLCIQKRENENLIVENDGLFRHGY